ncbi:MAG: hypothetical protein DSY90_12925 [Deltaproteobacteria bacterium]|nr:MAG: hypothetical protein DSY90_12925 [Deltaproteobacteria bacterium]
MPFSYYLYDFDRPLVESDSDWCAPLPLNRGGAAAGDSSPCYGDYFSSVQAFLTADNGSGLLWALSQHLNREIAWADIDGIHICIQKHGAFYHPARVDVLTGDVSTAFVVNVAISPEGQAGLSREFDNLNRLNKAFPRRYIPLAYHRGVGGTRKNCRRFPMFLGEWLSGYHEFHGTSFEDAPPFIQVWDAEQSRLHLPGRKVLLYRRASEILTHYYNPETFEQIFPWHHGAGDFVVRIQGDNLDLRLISVRRYTPLVEADTTDPVAVLEALLRFFLHLSLRMRIDRVGGTGDLIWMDETAVKGTIAGFFDGLARKNGASVLAEPIAGCAVYYFSRQTLADITEALSGILTAYPSRSPERRLMAFHLTRHAEALLDGLRRYFSSANCP